MKMTPEYSSHLTEKILLLETKLELLEKEILEIGQPAGQELQRRFNMLKIEEGALRRNFEASLRNGEPDSVRLAKIEQLLNYIENEEAALAQPAEHGVQRADAGNEVAFDEFFREFPPVGGLFLEQAEDAELHNPLAQLGPDLRCHAMHTIMQYTLPCIAH